MLIYVGFNVLDFIGHCLNSYLAFLLLQQGSYNYFRFAIRLEYIEMIYKNSIFDFEKCICIVLLLFYAKVSKFKDNAILKTTFNNFLGRIS